MTHGVVNGRHSGAANFEKEFSMMVRGVGWRERRFGSDVPTFRDDYNCVLLFYRLDIVGHHGEATAWMIVNV